MNTVDQTTEDLERDQTQKLEDPGHIGPLELKISGFDGDTRSVFKEPSLYLSIAIIFVAAAVCVGNSPTIFWATALTLSALAVMFQVLAERFIFRSKKEFSYFKAPFEGVFVLTFGSILPGLGLLIYGVYSWMSATQSNISEEIGKIALLLVVPFFNFLVWSAMRKGYLARPRMVGLMNGLALGLSACWTAVLLKSLFFTAANASCKFGWMLLLCTSPFLLFSALCLCLDLMHKTEVNIRRITTTFAVLGAILSCLFVCAPLMRAAFMQSLLTDAKTSAGERQLGAFELLRSFATDEDLRPSKHPVSGFALGALLLPERGLNANSEEDKNLFFRITGNPFLDATAQTASINTLYSPLVGGLETGLSLTKSQISGIVDATTLSSSIDWTLNIHNSATAADEARAEILMPDKAVVSRVTLWIDGVPREAAFASTPKVQRAYESVTKQKRDPLLVTSSGPNRILVQCFPVPANGEVRVRLGFKMPMETKDGKNCIVDLPNMVSSNFAQPKRTRVSIYSPDAISSTLPGLAAGKRDKMHTLNGILKAQDHNGQFARLSATRTSDLKALATPDWYSNGKRFIVQRLMEKSIAASKRLFVVLDASASLKANATKIKEALAQIPTHLAPRVYFIAEKPSDTDQEQTMKSISLSEALPLVTPETFVGGQDNTPVLREAIEVAAEQPGSAVLWIHGPQPTNKDQADTTALDMMQSISLYDLQIAPGPNTTMPALKKLVGAEYIAWETVAQTTPVEGINAIVSGWQSGKKELVLERKLVSVKPAMPISADPTTSAQLTSLWANDEVTRLLARDLQFQAQEIGSRYRLVTPVSGAVVLEDKRDYANNQLAEAAFKNDPASDSRAIGSGLVGAPVDPRYGQSNQVGALADYGYDCARDISRMLTLASFIVAIIVSITFLRGRKAITRTDTTKAISLALAVPTVVHLMGTFVINNFGGLGGGL